MNLRDATLIRDAHTHFSGHPDIVSVGIGYRMQQGRRTGDVCYRLRVRKKLPPDKLRGEQLLPKSFNKLPTDIVDGVPVLGADLNYGARYPVLLPGMSVGGPTVTGLSGSLGPLVVDNAEGWLGVVTCWHVVSSGPTADSYAIHPGSGDGGTGPYDSIGAIKRTVISGSGDGALIKLAAHAGTHPLGTTQRFSSVKNAEVGDSLQKAGRSTGLTTGEVSGISVQAFDYSDWGLTGYPITCLEIEPNSGDPTEEISLQGDSGSAWWIPATNELVGLHTGHIPGSPFVALAQDITSILTFLYCDIPTVVESRKWVLGGFNVSERSSGQGNGAFTVVGMTDPVLLQLGAIESSGISYATLDEYAVAMGFVDGDAFLTAKGFNPAEEENPGDAETAFAMSKGYASIAEFVSNQGYPSMGAVLAGMGVSFD